MLKHEYDAMQEAEREASEPRSWLFTIITGILSFLPLVGTFSIWHHALQDNSLFLTIILPLAAIWLLLVLAALGGRPASFVRFLRDTPGIWLWF